MSTPFYIEKIEIEQFKKIQNLTFDLKKEPAIFFGGIGSGKTSICEFILFALYGEEAVFLPMRDSENFSGRLWILRGKEHLCLERSLIAGLETLSFTDENQNPVPFEASPGFTLTGMDREGFDLVAYFEQGHYGKPFSRPDRRFIRQISRTRQETDELYRDFDVLENDLHAFCNEEKTGKLDLIAANKEALTEKLRQKPLLEEEIRVSEEHLADISAKLEENDKRVVILKADLAAFTDDRKLFENKENALEMKNEILAKEKKLRILNFELSGKIGKLSQNELEEMKNLYNALSLSITELAEARNRLTMAEENLSYHQTLFTGKDNLADYEDASKKIKKNKNLHIGFQSFGILFIALGGICGFLLHYYELGWPIALAAMLSLALVGISFFCLSTIFSSAIRKIISEFERANLGDFEHAYGLLEAHAKSEEIYHEQATLARRDCEKKIAASEAAEDAIFKRISALGYTEDDGEILAICDEIIEANEGYFDLEAEIEAEKAEYERLIRANVEKDSSDLSSEFVALQKELDFLLRQNESLMRKRALLQKKLEELRAALPDEAQLQKEISVLSQTEKEMRNQFRALQIDFSLVESRKNEFEKGLKALLAERINEKLSFRLSEEERYLFDDEFELCYCGNGSVLRLANFGGGIAELGFLAFRLSLAELIWENPTTMIFDDPFAFFDAETAKSLSQVLQASSQQLIIATSSMKSVELLQDKAVLFTL